MACLTGTALRFQHRSKIPPCSNHKHHKENCQERVEAIENRIKKDAVWAEVKVRDPGHRIPNQPNLIANPSGHQRDRRHWSSRRVNDIGELLTGNFQAIRDGPTRVANDQSIGIVIKKYEKSKRPHRYLAAFWRIRTSDNQLDNATHPTVSGNDADHSSNHEREQHNAYVVAIGNRVRQIDIKSIQKPSEEP